MPRSSALPAICSFCHAIIPKKKNSIEKHLRECPKILHDAEKMIEKYTILIEWYEYWLLITAEPETTLNRLDSFLRAVWLECCGHMSEFSLGEPYSWSALGTTRTLEDIARMTDTWSYVYDHGSSTYLSMTLFGSAQFRKEKNPITLMMRNEVPKFPCAHCEKLADSICSFCVGEWSEAYLCSHCIEKHSCVIDEWEPYMIMSLLNSPRTGTCGYDKACIDEKVLKKYLPNLV